MNYCSKCGKELAPGTKFCPICGTPTPDENLNMNAAPNQVQPPIPGQEPQPQAQPQPQPQAQNPAPPFVDPNTDPDSHKMNAPKKKSSKGVIAAVIAAVVLLAGAGGAVGYLMLKGDKDSDSSSSKKKSSKSTTVDEDDEEDTTKRKRSSRKTTTEAETDEPTTEEVTTAPTTERTTETTTEPTTEAPTSSNSNSLNLGKVKLAQGGDKFTIVSWDANDAPKMIELYERNGGQKANFHNMACKNSEAAEKLDNLFKAGEDVDLYFCESDWALNFINDDRKAAPLEDLGFTEDNFSNMFSYTNEVGRATKGSNAGKMVGVSWQACPGGFVYNTKLAKQYLGVEDEIAMQERINNWDKFVATATEIAEKSDHKVALADSLGGMWQVFSANRSCPWVEDGILLVDDSCKQFADYAKYLWDNGGVTRNSQWGDGWTAAGQQDLCMGYFASTWGLNGFVAEASSKSRGQWKLIQGPAPYFWGGTWMVVNPNTDNAGEAQEFIYTLCVDPASMKYYAKSKPEYVNNISVMDDVIKNKYLNAEVYSNFGAQNYFEPLHQNAKNINLKGLITPYDAQIKASFIDAVINEYCKGKDWDSTVARFKENVNSQFPSGLE